MPELDDHELLAEFARNGSESAFSALVTRYVGLVYSTALRSTRNPHQAQEIAQAVFIILARKAKGLSPNVVLSGWLYQTAQLTASNFIKGEYRRQRREQEIYMQSTENTAETQAWEKIAPLLDEAVGSLGEVDRNAVVLRYFQNQSAAQIGAVLRMTEETARRRVNRAVEKLQRYFSKRGITFSAVVITGAVAANSVQAAPAGLAATLSSVALSQGAAASGSTLTLVKGVLKIMAWTKVKTTIVVGVGVLLAAGTTTITINQIAEHRADELWRVPNPNPDKVPKEVKILPTKFKNSPGIFYLGGQGDNWVGLGTGAGTIAQVAYAWRPGRIIFEVPYPTNRYDFISTLPKDSGFALQKEMKKKLGLVGHRETRETEVLVLKVKRPNAPGLRLPTAGRSDYQNKGRYYCDNSPISSEVGYFPGITRALEVYFVLPVIDETGLTQNFHIDLKWNERFEKDPDHTALKQALFDQLGLELVPSRQPIEMLVIEKAR